MKAEVYERRAEQQQSTCEISWRKSTLSMSAVSQMHLSTRRGELCQTAAEETEGKKAGATRNRGELYPVCWLPWEKGIGISDFKIHLNQSHMEE